MKMWKQRHWGDSFHTPLNSFHNIGVAKFSPMRNWQQISKSNIITMLTLWKDINLQKSILMLIQMHLPSPSCFRTQRVTSCCEGKRHLQPTSFRSRVQFFKAFCATNYLHSLKAQSIVFYFFYVVVRVSFKYSAQPHFLGSVFFPPLIVTKFRDTFTLGIREPSDYPHSLRER